jgi:glycosyltransferase involved in cell wall biosynthesis
MKKLLFQTNIETPYKNKFFNHLSKNYKIDVLFEKRSVNHIKLNSLALNKNVHTRTFNGFNIFLFFTLLFKLLFRHYDFVFLSNFRSINSIFFIFILIVTKSSFYIIVDGAKEKKESFLKYTFKKIIFRSAKGIFSTSYQTDSYFLNYKVENNKLHRYPFSSYYDYETLNRPLNANEVAKLRKKYRINNIFTMVYGGRLIEEKGIEDLFLLSLQLKFEHQIILIGNQPIYNTFIFNLAKKYSKAKIIIMDFMASNELFDYFKSSDLVLFPSKDDIWGLSVIEAMACGKIVIGTFQTNVCNFIYNDKKLTCFYHSGDLKKLENLVNLYYYNRFQLKKDEKIALRISKIFTIQNMVNTINNVLIV